MKRCLLTLLIALPAAAEPHAEIRPAIPGERAGTFNRFETPPIDTGRLDRYRAEQAAEADRKAKLKAAELSAPKIEINVRPTTVIVEKRHQSRNRSAR